MTHRIDRDFLAADIAAIDTLVAQMTDDDFATKLALESRRAELSDALESIPLSGQTLASATLFFSGKPVVGSQGIESGFGAGAIAAFQDIVSTVSAARQSTALGRRGPVPRKEQSKLHITGIVHGSFGFQFEELDNPSIFSSDLKESVDQAVQFMASFDELDDDVFSEALEDLDNRVLETMRRFFELVQMSEATFRIVTDNLDKEYDRLALERATDRVRTTRIQEESRTLTGQLEGLLPSHRTFEFRASDGCLIYGKFDESLAPDEISKLKYDWLDKDSMAEMRVKQILRPGRSTHEAFFLVKLVSLAG